MRLLKNNKLSKYIMLICMIYGIMQHIHSQNWTEPVNVSNMAGANMMPDFCFNSLGIIHCVWVHKLETNHSKIFYSNSDNDGITWSIPVDISLNDEKQVAYPRIECDSEDNLHLTYDFDINNYVETLIHYKKFNGNSWSDAQILSENMPGSHGNKLVIDNNDKVYCFWFRNDNDGTTYYKYLENGGWSDTFCPYPGNYYLAIVDIKCDSDNNLHCIGAFHGLGQNHYNDRVFYTFYNEQDYLWDDITVISEETYGNDMMSIDLDDENFPHVAYRQNAPFTGPGNDSTMYLYFNGDNWSLPELVVEDPKRQRIIIDDYNEPNIFDTEKTEEGQNLVYYYSYEDLWIGYILDETPNSFFNPVVNKNSNIIYLVYMKSIMALEGQIFMSKMDMITSDLEYNSDLGEIHIFPNPFKEKLTVKFETKINCRNQLRIYSMDGKLIKTLLDENSPLSQYKIDWDGSNQNGDYVTPGFYLLRIQAGRNVSTRSIQLVK